ncbi:MAG: AraC family transcriptional regulator [Myxococcaceae bacterium]|nr:AraC family transcriptional regulator [Myxococcaceae bacterium]
MASSISALTAAAGSTTTRVFFPAGEYRHPASGLVQLRVVRSGSSYAEIDLGAGVRRVFTRPGDLLLSLPDSPTLFRIEDARELTMISIHRELAERLLRAANGSLRELRVVAERPLRDPLLAEICRRMEDAPPSTEAVHEWTLGIALSSLLALAKARARIRDPKVLTSGGLRAVLTAIDAGLDATLSVERLAEVSGLARRAFARAFREATGLPVYQYILRRRVHRAVELLSNTELPLAQVAQQTGFTHQAHMTRVVSRLKATTPGQLRARAR